MRKWFQIWCSATGIFLSLPSLVQSQSIKPEIWGELPDGREVMLYTLDSGSGVTAKISTYGAILQQFIIPDRSGESTNILLSYHSLEEALKGGVFGSVIGRFANRIDKGGFTIDGDFFPLETVNAKTGVHIHGGKRGMQRQLWTMSSPRVDKRGVSLTLSLTSPDGEEGYPGEVEVSLQYTLTDKGVLKLIYRATTTRATHLNLTNHAYFNLAGSGTILDHKLELNADSYLEVDARKIPTGKLTPVENTPFAFTKEKRIGDTIDQIEGGGYDHCYVIDADGAKSKLHKVATLSDPESGRALSVFTTKPGVQIYTANHFSGEPFPKWGGICFETQYFPDTPNHSHFPSSLLRPGQEYQHTTEFRVSNPD